MKPLNRKYYKSPSKTDCHPHKGYINWWEAISIEEGTSKLKQKVEDEISSGKDEYIYEKEKCNEQV